MTLAMLTGVTVIGFSWLTECATDIFVELRAWHWWVPLLWTPACAGAIVWCTRRFAAGASGTGIPQGTAALDGGVDEAGRGRFASLRLSVGRSS